MGCEVILEDITLMIMTHDFRLNQINIGEVLL
jgi:hypothetical protein